MNYQRLSFAILALILSAVASSTASAQIYKWTDASGQVHYGQKKPADTDQAQSLNIPSTPTTSVDPAVEIARIKALSEQMARERQTIEQARQEQAIRNLQQANQQLQNELLSQQLQQQEQKEKDEEQETQFLAYPLPQPYPYPHPYWHSRPYPRPYPPQPWPPCTPWPECRHPSPPQPPDRPPAKPPIPPFNPKPIGISPTPEGFIRHR
ncbi:MAG: DUF4124 domain-containing protein [Candidatus Contendobacter sp.]